MNRPRLIKWLRIACQCGLCDGVCGASRIVGEKQLNRGCNLRRHPALFAMHAIRVGQRKVKDSILQGKSP